MDKIKTKTTKTTAGETIAFQAIMDRRVVEQFEHNVAKDRASGKVAVPAAACPRCGGWTGYGGMSQHSTSTVPVIGRTGCVCHR